jgi:hypothetical protein
MDIVQVEKKNITATTGNPSLYPFSTLTELSSSIACGIIEIVPMHSAITFILLAKWIHANLIKYQLVECE